jgi:hypothetical protein
VAIAGRLTEHLAIEAVTQVSSRVELPRAEFNRASAIFPYIDSEGIRIGCR